MPEIPPIVWLMGLLTSLAAAMLRSSAAGFVALAVGNGCCSSTIWRSWNRTC